MNIRRLALLLLLPTLSHAAGTSTLSEQGYLSSIRAKSDLTHAYLNPALLGDLHGGRFDGMATYLYGPNLRFIGNDGNRADLLDSLVIPAAHAGKQVSDDCAIAGNLLSPFGVGVEHYQREAILKTMEISANAGCQVNEHFSLGAGLSGLYTDAYLKEVVPLNNLGLPDGRLKLDTGKSWAIGWNVGALFKFDPIRLGVSYRAPYHMRNDVRAHWIMPSAVKPLFPNSHGTVDTNLPGSLDAGISWAMTDNLELWFNWRRDFWSQSQHLTVDYKNTLPMSIVNFAFKDSDRFALGVAGDWRPYSTEVSLFFDQSPVPNAAKRQWLVPDSNRIGFLVSGGYRITPTVKLSANYEHISFQDSHATQVLGRYRGLEYHLLSAKIGWEF